MSSSTSSKYVPAAFAAAFLAVLALAGCKPADGDGQAQENGQISKSETSANQQPLAGDDFDWTTVHFKRPVTVLHTWPENMRVPPIAAINSTGSRLVFADESKEVAGGSAVWLMNLPGGEKRKLFDVEGAVFNLILSDTGKVLFCVSLQGGQLYSIEEGKVWARVDYEDCKEVVALGPGGNTMTCWGGGTGTLRHYSKTFNLLSVEPFWEDPLPSDSKDVYSGKSVIFLPDLAITQIIVQVGTKENPKFTLLTLNTSQKQYYRHHQMTYAYLVGGVLNKTGEIYRCLLAQPENWRGRNSEGHVPLTHRLIFNTADMSYKSETIKPFSDIPLAMDRLAEIALVDTADGSLTAFKLDDGSTVATVPAQQLGECKFVAAAGDLGGFIAICGKELRWYDLDKFAVKPAK
ncbi:MAG: hypothetical protein HRF49_04610 [bacterium]|jgi:hypothetical protein